MNGLAVDQASRGRVAQPGQRGDVPVVPSNAGRGICCNWYFWMWGTGVPRC